MRINQAHVKCCLLSNQTIVCLVSFFIFAFGNERRIRESDRKKKAGCGIFDKNLSSNRRSKSRMESDNLEEPLVFNYTIASSYHLGDLFLSFFFFFLQKTCFNALHLQAVQRRLKGMRVRMAEDLCQRIVSAEAKWSFPLLALKKGKIILPKFLFFFFEQMQAIYQSRRVPNNLLIVGTFSEALVKLGTPSFPTQTKLNSEQNRWK